MIDINTSVQYVKGVGPQRQKLFKKLGVETIADALLFIPLRYEDRRQIVPIAQINLNIKNYKTIIGKIVRVNVHATRKHKRLFEVVLTDTTGFIKCIWFRFNEKYMRSIFKHGARIIVSGQITYNPYKKGSLEMLHPNYEFLTNKEEDLIHVGRIVPIYHTTEGFHQKSLRTIIKTIIDEYANSYPDILPEYIKKKLLLLDSSSAIKQVHFPDPSVNLESLHNYTTAAHKRLIFEEFFLLELGLANKRYNQIVEKIGIRFQIKTKLEKELREILPFTLTQAQEKVITHIKNDMAKPHSMNRLLQGDVGCGKTIVALIAMLIAVDNGYQSTIMAPTEILAEQHYLTIHRYLDLLKIKTCLLSSGIKSKDKIKILEEINKGKIHIVIGTHALIQEGVEFSNLGLAVIDEQHRFGVMQRSCLRKKGKNPDVLVMTATPIPRTLALTVYGDLALSVIDQMPKGRRPIETKLFYERDRNKAYTILNSEIKKGRQVYVVYPLIEESEKIDLKAATEMSQHLQKNIFPHLKIALLHGRMKTEEKEWIMENFKNKNIDILVSTTVIEVGVDVSNASVMLIEHAERFGLSQLHQLRGRVGRGPYQSYCLLLANFPMSKEAKRRLNVIVNNIDGFVIAEEDLAIRGPGEFFGLRQSGLPDLKIANILRDSSILELARQEAFYLINQDPHLAKPEYSPLKTALANKWHKKLDLVKVG